MNRVFQYSECEMEKMWLSELGNETGEEIGVLFTVMLRLCGVCCVVLVWPDAC